MMSPTFEIVRDAELSADVEHEQRGPRGRDRGGNPAREDVPGFERPRTALHDHVSTEPPNVGYPL